MAAEVTLTHLPRVAFPVRLLDFACLFGEVGELDVGAGVSGGLAVVGIVYGRFPISQ